MKFYSQKDNDYAYHKLGTCNTTIKANGCFVTSYAMLDGRTPAEVNSIFTKKGCYSGGCNIVQSKCSKALELEDKGRSTKEPDYICIAETDHYKRQGVPQHFYIWNPNGTIVDPLDKNPTWKKNPYNIVSYRLIKAKQLKEETMNKYEVRLLEFIKSKVRDWGDNLNSSEEKKTENDIENWGNRITTTEKKKLEEDIERLKKEILVLKSSNNSQTAEQIKKYENDIVVLNNKLKDRNNENTQLANKKAETTAELQAIKQDRDDLIIENEKLQSLQDSNYEALTLISRFQEAIRLIMAFKSKK